MQATEWIDKVQWRRLLLVPARQTTAQISCCAYVKPTRARFFDKADSPAASARSNRPRLFQAPQHNLFFPYRTRSKFCGIEFLPIFCSLHVYCSDTFIGSFTTTIYVSPSVERFQTKSQIKSVPECRRSNRVSEQLPYVALQNLPHPLGWVVR